MRQSVAIADLNATHDWGRRLGGRLFAGAVVALVGPLGAGKTHLARAIAEGLGIANPLWVNSPTFVLIQEYPARLPIYHFDAYRLSGAGAFHDLGAEEYLFGDGVCLVEWADRVGAAMPQDRLEIQIEVLPGEARQFHCHATGERHARLLQSPESGGR